MSLSLASDGGVLPSDEEDSKTVTYRAQLGSFQPPPQLQPSQPTQPTGGQPLQPSPASSNAPPVPPRDSQAGYSYQRPAMPSDKASNAFATHNSSSLPRSGDGSYGPRYVPVQEGRGDHSRNSSGDSSSSSSSRRGSTSLPAGTNRFSQLSFDGEGKLVCTVLPSSTAPIAFGLWAYYLAIATALLCLFFGPFAILWWHYNTAALYSDTLSLVGGVYSVCLAVLIVYEELYGLPVGLLASFFDAAVSRYTIRSVGYFFLSSVLFFSWPTVIPAISLCITAIVNRIACAMGERFEYGGQRPALRRGDDEPRKSMCWRMYSAFLQPLFIVVWTIRSSNRIGIVIWLFIYAGGNTVLFVLTTLSWIDKVGNSRQAYHDGLIPHNMVLSYWITPAKAFGLVLDLNCALILLPVCRTVIKYLYERSTIDQHCTTKALRFALKIVPLDFALHFHKLIGFVILFAAVGHTLAHFVNYALAETVTLTILAGPWPLISGGLIIGVMLLMYTSTMERLRLAKFELFFETHHLFILFFVLLLVHGAHGKGPNFWKYFIGPAALYVCERLYRIHRGRMPVEVRTAHFMQDVMCLEFAKKGVFERPYRTGQFVHLQCPAVSPLQWHPFTISSAPSDPSVTLHIKIATEKPSSFTYRLAAYMTSLRPTPRPAIQPDALNAEDPWEERKEADAFIPAADAQPWPQRQTTVATVAESGFEHIIFDRADQLSSSRVPGRYVGPDGRPLFRIDGPHSAPTQHLAEYKIAVVVGAGIGCTPLSACLRQVVHHDWALDRPEEKYRPSKAYFILLLQHDKINSFRWLIKLIRETQYRVNQLRAQGRMKDKLFEVHIYVTSPPRNKDQQQEDYVAIEQRAARVSKAASSMGRGGARPSVGGDPTLTWDDYQLAMLMTKPRLRADKDEAKWTSAASPASAGSYSITVEAGDPASAASASVPAGPSDIPLRPAGPAVASAAVVRLDDVRVYSGRPNFNQIFGALNARHSQRKVGVMFCGMPAIANTLREECKVQNRSRAAAGGTRFQLHAENF